MQAGRKSALYRDVNLATAALLAQYHADEAGHFLCECDDEDCARRLELRRAEFEAVRASGGLLVSSQCVNAAAVLQRGDGYAAVASPYCSSIEK